MKNLFIGVIFLILGSNAQADLMANCQEQVKIGARTVWSLNSGIDMQNLTAEILSQKWVSDKEAKFSVIVNAPKFPETPQKVPYSILASESSGNSGCFIKQITAINDNPYGK